MVYLQKQALSEKCFHFTKSDFASQKLGKKGKFIFKKKNAILTNKEPFISVTTLQNTL